MKYSVRFSPFAKEDKEEIKTYLSRFYPETPRRFTALLKKHIANLKDNPYVNPEYPEPSAEAKGRGSPPGNPNYRRMLVGNYIVFYKINDAEKQIDIYRILSASWDLPKYL